MPENLTALNRSELAFAESQILEIQKELDAHKQECYGHMKVIQEMRFGKMQASQLDLSRWRGLTFKLAEMCMRMGPRIARTRFLTQP